MRERLGAALYLGGLALCVFAANQGWNTTTASGFALVIAGYCIANADDLL